MKCPMCGSNTLVTDSRNLVFDDEGIPNPHNYTSLKECLDMLETFSEFKTRCRTCTACGLAKTTIEVDVHELRRVVKAESTL